jgi:hypothetical protein
LLLLEKQGLDPLDSVKTQWEYGLLFQLILNSKTKKADIVQLMFFSS